MQAWKAIGSILRDGGSWSGHERNCCFLNTASNRFADVSAMVGLNHADDSRAVGLVDWDQDGDLDLWYANRTAPRLRYLQNNSETHHNHAFFSIRLQGTNSNRDAIGARVTVESSINGKTLRDVRTLRAGEGYLSQSSKWLHFGLGRSELKSITVRWPNGNQQTFDHLEANRRYSLVEGKTPSEIIRTRQVNLVDQPQPVPKANPHLRIVPARRFPIPQLQLEGSNGKPALAEIQQTTLITIWATWCQPCISEMKRLEQASDLLRNNQIRWLPINVDDRQDESAEQHAKRIRAKLKQFGITVETSIATQSAIEALDAVQRVLTSKPYDLQVPSSFLIDRQGKLMVVFKGSVSAEQIAKEVKSLEQPTVDPRDVATPFKGSWTSDTFPADLLAIPQRFAAIGRTQEAVDYMVKHIAIDQLEPPLTPASLSSTYLKLARQLVQKKEFSAAEKALLQTLKINSQLVQARMALGEVYMLQKQSAKAIEQYKKILKLVPDQPMVINNLSWLFATTSDESIRNPKEALQLARQLCGIIGYDDSISLDALSVALAANGQFEQAIEYTKKAISLAEKSGKPSDRMRDRLQLFQRGKPYLER